MLYVRDNGLASTNNDLPPTQLHSHATEQVYCLAEGSKYSEHTQPEQKKRGVQPVVILAL